MSTQRNQLGRAMEPAAGATYGGIPGGHEIHVGDTVRIYAPSTWPENGLVIDIAGAAVRVEISGLGEEDDRRVWVPARDVFPVS